MSDQDFSNIGQQIRDAVMDALDSQNFTQLKGMIKDTVKEISDAIPAQQNPPRNTAARNASSTNRRQQPSNALTRAPQAPESVSSALKIIFGVSGAIPLGIGAIAATFFTITSASVIAALPAGLLYVAAGVFTWLAGNGISVAGKRARFRKYWKALQPQGYATIDQLAKAAGAKRKTTTSDIKYMMKKGYFGEAYLDEQGNTFMIGRENYDRYLHTLEELQKRKQGEVMESASGQKQEPDDGVKAVTAEGREWIKQIRNANDDLPGKIISTKLDRLELVTSKILAHVEKYPDQLPAIRKFMSYYLPTTLKLVNAYREFEKQPVQGSNITTAKKEIEETLDTINVAFENLLDNLFQKAALDVSTDISVLETMLAQEGLTGSDFNDNDTAEKNDDAEIELNFMEGKEE